MRRISAIAAVAAACAAFAAPAAASAGGDQVIRDCADDGKLDRHYSPRDLNDANSSLPTDIREYTDCEAVIAAARRDAGGSGGSGTGDTGSGPGGGTGGGGGAPSSDPAATTKSGATGHSPADVSALRTETQQAKHSSPSIQAGGGTVTPASSGLDHVAGAANEMPASLIVAIALLAGLCAVGGVVAARRRWPVIARAPLRLIRR
ncbi:MAG: hypothetical protein ACJ760_05000 [Thermoleophilaceae bacterium]